MIIFFILILISCSKNENSFQAKSYAIAGTINTISGYPDSLAVGLIRIKNLSDNLYVQDAIVKINGSQITYNSSALGYSTITIYKNNQNYKVEIIFDSYNVSIDCLSGNLDSIRVMVDKDSVNRGDIINVKWRYFGMPSGKNMILLKKKGSVEFNASTGYIPISDTTYQLNTSNLEITDYDLLLISGNFCIINNFEPYPNFPNSLIFVGRGSTLIIKIR
ncbi:MAG: hypothetical protein ABIL76_04830 [candidate division WOR-3 bacterium]